MIAACPSCYFGAADPLIIQTATGQTVLYMVDGSGSWGLGVEAAAWFRDWLALAHDSGKAVGRLSVTAALQLGMERMPAEFVDDDFGCVFSIVAAIVDDHIIQLGACGGFASVAVSQSKIQRLITPVRLIDELVVRGLVPESEAEWDKRADILCGPFLALDGQNDLIWLDPVPNTRGTQILIGAPGLPRYLESKHLYEWQTDPVKLRDAVELFSRRSAPTAIISSLSRFD